MYTTFQYCTSRLSLFHHDFSWYSSTLDCIKIQETTTHVTTEINRLFCIVAQCNVPVLYCRLVRHYFHCCARTCILARREIPHVHRQFLKSHHSMYSIWAQSLTSANKFCRKITSPTWSCAVSAEKNLSMLPYPSQWQWCNAILVHGLISERNNHLNKLIYLTYQSFTLYEHTAHRTNLSTWFMTFLKCLLAKNNQKDMASNQGHSHYNPIKLSSYLPYPTSKYINF